MAGRLHPVERRGNRPPRIGQKGRDPGEALVGFGVKDMEDRADEQCVACFFPVISLLEAAFRIDQHIGDILNVAHFRSEEHTSELQSLMRTSYAVFCLKKKKKTYKKPNTD